jgi:hypothetical protein
LFQQATFLELVWNGFTSAAKVSSPLTSTSNRQQFFPAWAELKPGNEKINQKINSLRKFFGTANGARSQQLGPVVRDNKAVGRCQSNGGKEKEPGKVLAAAGAATKQETMR